jgi:glyoxylate reductase
MHVLLVVSQVERSRGEPHDLLAVQMLGISISSTPVAVNHATADIAVFLMIGAMRQAQKPLAGVRAGKWRGDFTLGHDPNKKVLGIIGMGGIGRVGFPPLNICAQK